MYLILLACCYLSESLDYEALAYLVLIMFTTDSASEVQSLTSGVLYRVKRDTCS
jgi:hypothetical protein